MYESFFELSEKPFSLVPDPAFLFCSEKHKTALSLFEYSLAGGAGLSVVTGEVGAGKTTLIRHFLQGAHDETRIGVISNPHTGFGGLLDWVSQAFSLSLSTTDKVAAYAQFIEFLNDQMNRSQRTVLVVDEAQSLSTEMLEQLRLLSNVNTDKRQLLQMILVGQPELLDKLRSPDLRQFAQRISVHYHLLPLTLKESHRYIRHRLGVAGSKLPIFDALAMTCVHFVTGGVPRLINAICDMALVYAFAHGYREIGLDTIAEVVRDRESGKLLTLPRSLSNMGEEDLVAQLSSMMNGIEIEPEVKSPAESAGREHTLPRAKPFAEATSQPETEVSTELDVMRVGRVQVDLSSLFVSSQYRDEASRAEPQARTEALRPKTGPAVSDRHARPRLEWGIWKRT